MRRRVEGLDVVVGVLIAGYFLLGSPAWAQNPAVVGQWGPLMSWPISATHTHVLPTGKVFFFGEFDDGEQRRRFWDPVTNALTSLPAPLFNIFCSLHS